jgi:short subunit dehydrogenase-like uncharacterized protein
MTTHPRSDWMLYGAYGSTGRLILDEALRRGHRPILAGRDDARLSALGHATADPDSRITRGTPDGKRMDRPGARIPAQSLAVVV